MKKKVLLKLISFILLGACSSSAMAIKTTEVRNTTCTSIYSCDHVRIIGDSNKLERINETDENKTVWSQVLGDGNTISDSSHVNVTGDANKLTNVSGADIVGTHGVYEDSTRLDVLGSGNHISSANNSQVIGHNNTVTGNGSSVLGVGTNVTSSNSVTLGQKSTNNRNNTVSVGSRGNERQITNVANGTQANDAVNYTQLSAVDGRVTTNANNITKNSNSITKLGDTLATNITDIKSSITNITANGEALAWDSKTKTYSASRSGTATNKITNVANGTQANDAVNYTQLSAVDGRVTTNANNITKNSNSITKLGDTLATNITDIKSSITNITANGEALAWDSKTKTYSASRSRTATNKITNVANGTQANDAVNLSQLNAVDVRVTTNTDNIADIQSSISNGDFLTWDSDTNSYSATRGETLNNRITNVEDGIEDNDAVNYSQLNTVNGKIVTLGEKVANNTNTISNLNDKVVNNTNNINDIKSSITNMTISGDFLTWNSNSNSYSATRGETLNNRITNVENGIENNDAVNLSQLNTVKDNLTNQINQLGEQVNQNTTDISNGVSSSDLTELQNSVNKNTSNISQNKTNITQNTNDINELKTSVTQNTTDITSINNEINNIKVNGVGSPLIQNNTSDTTVKASATGSGALSVGSGSQSTADNSVALGTNSIADRENSVSVGSKDNERQITNVKAGTQDTDAVNFSQLKQMQTSQNAFEKSTNQRFQSVYEEIAKNQKENRSGISSAMAMSAIPQAFDYGSGLVGAGMATYKGETAIAIGASRVSEDGLWTTKLNASANSNNNFSLSFGVGYSW